MTTEKLHRKLTAILSADVVGYSRLMGDDEEATVLTLKKFKEMIFGLIERHNGRLVDSPGDNLLAEFASVVDAVRCGVQIQEDLKVSNEELPPNRKMVFRIGINIGDVIQDGDRIFGDGVNVAARIESLADPGGICISSTAYDQVKKKLDIDYEYQGEYEVKNIDEPVKVYRVKMEPGSARAVVKKKKPGSWTWQRAGLYVAAIIILGVVAAWYFSFRQAPVVSDVEEAIKTIAVLPFDDLSPEKDQEYFAAGLSEELLDSLEKIPALRVIAKTSSFAFKGGKKTVQEIADVLGANHILEGSVRKSGDDLRITAQLIRASDGIHLWSDIYDRKLEDIFDVQEDIAKAVCNALKITLGIDNQLKTSSITGNAEAYALYLVAKGRMGQPSVANYSSALESINSAIEMDPEFALAWAWKSFIHIYLSFNGPEERAATEQDTAQQAALKAIELEPNLAEAHLSLSWMKTASLTKNEVKELSYQLEASEEELQGALARLDDELAKKEKLRELEKEWQKKMREDSLKRSDYKDSFAIAIGSQYSDFFEELNLSIEKQEEFKNIHVMNMVAQTDLREKYDMNFYSQPSEETRAEFQKFLKALNEETEEKIKNLLGNTGYEKYQVYMETTWERSMVDGFVESLNEGEALTEQQQQRLIMAMYEEFNNIPRISGNNDGEGAEGINISQQLEFYDRQQEAFLRAAEDILPSSQLEEFKAHLKKEFDGYKLNMEYYNLRNDMYNTEE